MPEVVPESQVVNIQRVCAYLMKNQKVNRGKIMSGKSLLNSRRSMSRILSELLIVAVVLVSVVAAWGFLRGQQATLSKVVEISLQEATLLKTSSGGVLNINIKNTGSLDLTIGSGSISGPAVSMSFDGLNGLLEAGKSKAAIVTISGSISAGETYTVSIIGTASDGSPISKVFNVLAQT